MSVAAVKDRAPVTGSRRKPLLPLPTIFRSRLIYGIVGTLLTLGAAQLLVSTQIIDERFVPLPTTALARLLELAWTPVFWAGVGGTMQGWAMGLFLAIVIALPLGFLIGTNDYLFAATRPVVEFLRPIPSVALIPVAILMLGIGMESKVFLVTLACLWPLLIQTIYGLRAIDPTLTATAQSFRIPRRLQLRSIVLPAILPYLATGFRIAATVALIVAVTAELVIGSPGIGGDILLAQSSGAVVTLYALVFAAGLIGVILNVLLQIVERRLLRWHPTYREAAP